MMKTRYKQLFACVAALLSAISVPAQDLPLLPGDPAVKQGVLPNGMTYYLSNNPSTKGKADFALVQKTGRLTTGDSADSYPAELARNTLDYVPRLGGRSPQDFMTDHGAAAGRNGFVEVTDDATIFRFPGIRLSDGKDMIDSTLLVVMDMTERVTWTEDDYFKKWYVPSDQAIIVSGDIDVNSVAEKLRMLSYMTPKGESSERKEHVWSSHDKPEIIAGEASADGLSCVSLAWRSARPPRSLMNTVQPVTFEMTMHSLGEIACMRLRKLLKDRNIPVADVAYEYIDASATPYDEELAVKAVVGADDSQAALLAIAEVMASLDGAGVSASEYRTARSRFVDNLRDLSSDPLKSNEECVDRCISAFMYNSSSGSHKEKLKYHESRNLPDTTATRLFNDIIAALLDGSKDLVVRCPEMPEGQSFLSQMDSVWTANAASGLVRSAAPNLRDTVSFPGIGPKVKIKSAKKDHLSGGTVWTFSNGFKVVYRNMPSQDRVYYTLALNGGYGSIPDLSSGEGAFLADYLDLCFIAGLKAADFKSILASEGITMNATVNLSNTLISGYAPENNISLLMRSLLALASDRRPDDSAFAYYSKCNELSLKHQAGSDMARMTAIDSIMCPGYIYSSYKAPGKLTPAFAAKAEKFYSGQFTKMNDGVLVIVGDINEDVLKKTLLQYAGAFTVKDAAFRRPMVKYQPVSGWSTYTVDGAANSVDVVMSARMPITAANYASAAVAALILEQRLAEKLSAAGLNVKTSYNCRIYPEERMNLIVSVVEAPLSGFAAGTEDLGSMDALSVLRSALSGMSRMEINEGRLSACKAYLKNAVSAEMKSPLYWTNAMTLRHLDGKDLTTGYASRIDAVKASDVQAVLELLESGSKVEYVIKGK